MYHGWQSLVPCQSPSGYRFTHPETQHELARLVRSVVVPLGPTLLSVPGAKSDVAFLESFASEMFARRGTYGWCGSWAGDAYHALLYARLQPEIVFDETIAERGLDGFRILVLADCDVLTRTVVERIVAFQQAGGLVIGDSGSCPPSGRISAADPHPQRPPARTRPRYSVAGDLRACRRPLPRHVDTTSAEIIPTAASTRTPTTSLLVTDRREYGSYVGQHGLVMERPARNDGCAPESSGGICSRPANQRPIEGRRPPTAAFSDPPRPPRGRC